MPRFRENNHSINNVENFRVKFDGDGKIERDREKERNGYTSEKVYRIQGVPRKFNKFNSIFSSFVFSLH